MTRRHVLSITVCVRSPFVFAGVEASAVGIDTPALRDEEGRPILPADQLKGLLRQAIEALKDAESKVVDGIKIEKLFGPKYIRDIDEQSEQVEPHNPFKSFAPQRGSLIFADLAAKTMRKPPVGADGTSKPLLGEWPAHDIKAWAKAVRDHRPGEAANHITRIKIDGDTGTVAHGMLQVVELAAPLAAVATFEGEAVLFEDDAKADKIVTLLDRALKIVPYFGGLRSAGFGEHVDEGSSIKKKHSQDVIPAAGRWPDSDRFELEGEFDRPYLVAAQRASGNIFVGHAVVPGGVIKGALAAMLKRAGRDPEHDPLYEDVVKRMQISHAFPLHETNGLALSRALPLSAMYDPGSKQYGCAFSADEPGLLNGNCADFQPDWKDVDRSAFAKTVERPESDESFSFLPRGHTTIDANTGVAQDQDLYVEVSRGALVEDGRRRRFRFTVDFGKPMNALSADEREAVDNIQKLLSTGLGGLDGVGKTRARFMIKFCKNAPDLPRIIPGRQDKAGKTLWRLLLETPAILVDPDDPKSPHKAEGSPVTASLNAYLKEIVQGAELHSHYVQRVLVGAYQARRRRPGGNAAPYRPYSLFAAGSCFLLEAAANKADQVAQRLAELMRTGLPVKRWQDGNLVGVTNWRECPYLPENGYGEISVDNNVFDLIAAASSRIAEDKARRNRTVEITS